MLPANTISAIVPTIGRPESLKRLLDSLVLQTCAVNEVVIADGSGTSETAQFLQDFAKAGSTLSVIRIEVNPPNAVRQRAAAIAKSQGELLLLLDDDVELETNCVAEMLKTLNSDDDVVAVMADFNNHSWSRPTRSWRFYLRWICRLKENQWQGKVVGPLLRYGYNPVPNKPVHMEWLGSGMSLIRRTTYEAAGGFSDFFLHRCTMNEDVDLGIKLRKHGRILLCPTAKMGHFHAPGGRVTVKTAAEDDLFNRFLVINKTLEIGKFRAFGLVMVFFGIETLGGMFVSLRKLQFSTFFLRTLGRFIGLCRIAGRLIKSSAFLIF